MSKKIQLSIAEPCHENWEGMTPVEKGKFCGSCQKQVVDFSNMSDRQVAEFFKKPSTGSVCGRFMTDQLERDIETPRKRIPWVKYFFQIALPAIFISKASAQNIKMGKPAVKDTVKRIPVTTELRTLGMVAPRNIEPVVCNVDTNKVLIKGEIKFVDKGILKGKIINENGEPVLFATIQIKGLSKGLMADENGFFEIKKEVLLENKTIVVSSVGYETKEVNVDANSNGDLLIQLSTKIMTPVVINSYGTVMGKIITGYVVCTTQKTVDTLKKNKPSPFLTKNEPVVNRTIATPKVEFIKIFPNPIASGGNITISLDKQEEGYYSLQLLALNGQIIQQKELWIDSEARVLTTQAPLVAAGNYFLILTNKKSGKKFSEKLIVQ